MAAKQEETIDWKKHRRATPKQPGSTLNRTIISCITLFLGCITFYYLYNYQQGLTFYYLPDFQRQGLIAFHIIYAFRSIISFNVFQAYRNYSRATVFVLGGIIIPLFTLTPTFSVYPIEEDWCCSRKNKIAIGLYSFGSFIHTFSEYQRWRFKADKSNKGKLYTDGLFASCRNPNFLGDILLFEGWYLLSNNNYNQLIPIFIAYNFVYKLIPDKEKYLKSKYGKEWIEYEKNTKSLFPYIL